MSPETGPWAGLMLAILTEGFPSFKKESDDDFLLEPSSVPAGRAVLGVWIDSSSNYLKGFVSPLTAATNKATVKKSRIPPPFFLRVFIFNIFKL